MADVRIGNGVLEATVSALGAELQSLRRLDTGLEYLWQGDAASWPRRAPVLFPIVGRLRGDRYLWKGAEYHLPQHGFARDRAFELVAHDAASATFVLADDDETRRTFPFSFRLAVTYRVDGATLETSLEVTNPGLDDLLFSVGGHPGFRCPQLPDERFEDCSLVFGQEETIGRWPVADGLIGAPPEPLLDGQRELPLSRDLFSRGALVFRDLRSTTVRLASRRSGAGLEVSFEGFPYFGVWSKPPGDFVCLEPWCGIADPVDASGHLEEKPGIVRLAPTCAFRRSFQVSPIP
ncbi:MAG: aldose 1-epimerase family protein [Thermoanaerobaculaceae bacterium]